MYLKKIDKHFNTEALIPKGIKEAEKKLSTTSAGAKVEREIIQRIEFLKNSVEFIRKKEKIDQ